MIQQCYIVIMNTNLRLKIIETLERDEASMFFQLNMFREVMDTWKIIEMEADIKAVRTLILKHERVLMEEALQVHNQQL